MRYRVLGKTGFCVSEIGFGAWGIGGPVKAGDVPLGWGNYDLDEARRAVKRAVEVGINFFDTADFYGLGQSETILGEVLRDSGRDVIIATKVGHTLLPDHSIVMDFSRGHILEACDASLRRLRREAIDLYQLHNPKREDLERGECIEAMELLQQQGKIRAWGVSVNTYDPEREGLWILERNVGDTLQVVVNVFNQRALQKVVPEAHRQGYGIIARMPLQFGLLTGKFTPETQFDPADHRSMRLPPPLLRKGVEHVERLRPLADGLGISLSVLALKFVLAHKAVSTVIPGIKTPAQAEQNAAASEAPDIPPDDLSELHRLFDEEFDAYLEELRRVG